MISSPTTLTSNSSGEGKASATGLPADWHEGFDAVHSRFYYFHKPTRRSTWTRPDFEAAGVVGANGGLGGGAATGGTATATDLDRDVSATSLNTSSANTTATSNIVSPASSITRLPTKSGEWLEVFSAEHNRVFYYNRVTRESVWTDPRVLLSASSPLRSPQHSQLQPPPSQQTSKVVMTSSSFSSSSASPAAASSSSTSTPTTTRATMRTMMGGEAGSNRLQESLDEYTRELQRSSQAVLEKTKQYSGDYSRSTFDEVNELAATAEALLGKARGGTTGWVVLASLLCWGDGN